MVLRVENYLHTVGVPVPDRLIGWAIQNLTEDDIMGDCSLDCGCPIDSDYEWNAANIVLMDMDDKWEVWMDGISPQNLFYISYCYDCRKWSITWDMEENKMK